MPGCHKQQSIRRVGRWSRCRYGTTPARPARCLTPPESRQSPKGGLTRRRENRGDTYAFLPGVERRALTIAGSVTVRLVACLSFPPAGLIRRVSPMGPPPMGACRPGPVPLPDRPERPRSQQMNSGARSPSCRNGPKASALSRRCYLPGSGAGPAPVGGAWLAAFPP